MGKPKVGYRSIIPASTLSGSTMSGFPLSNLADMKPYTFAKAPSLSAVDWDVDAGSNVPCDYIALCAHNLAAENVTLTLKGDTTFPPSTVRATIVPSDYPASGVFVKEFGSQTLRYWRLSLSAASANPAYIGVCNLGQIFTWLEPMPADLDAQTESVPSELEQGEAGHYLGAVLYSVDRRFDLHLGPAGGDWNSFFIPANLLNDFWTKHARLGYPFFFHPDITFSGFVPYYLVAQKDALLKRPNVGGSWLRRGFSFPVQTAIAESP